MNSGRFCKRRITFSLRQKTSSNWQGRSLYLFRHFISERHSNWHTGVPVQTLSQVFLCLKCKKNLHLIIRELQCTWHSWDGLVVLRSPDFQWLALKCITYKKKLSHTYMRCWTDISNKPSIHTHKTSQEHWSDFWLKKDWFWCIKMLLSWLLQDRSRLLHKEIFKEPKPLF